MPQIFILTGKIDSGKTSLLDQWIREYRNEDLKVAGILAPAIYAGGKKTGYEIMDIKTGKRRFMAMISEEPGEISIGRFNFFPEAIAEATRILSELNEENDLGIIDETGPLELEGKGLAEGLKEALSHPPKKLIIVVRENLVEKVTKSFRIESYKLLNITKTPEKP